jgi:hypothetical protein
MEASCKDFGDPSRTWAVRVNGSSAIRPYSTGTVDRMLSDCVNLHSPPSAAPDIVQISEVGISPACNETASRGGAAAGGEAAGGEAIEMAVFTGPKLPSYWAWQGVKVPNVCVSVAAARSSCPLDS